MINPDEITDFNRSVPELEELLLFSVAAAGKDGWLTARALNKFLKRTRELAGSRRTSPLGCVRFINERMGMGLDGGDDLAIRLKNAGFGCYNQRARSFTGILNSGFDLRTVTTEELEQITGISFKTSRLFVLHSRPDQNIIPIDRHMMSYVRRQEIIQKWNNELIAAEGVNLLTPNPPDSAYRYKKLEQLIVRFVKETTTMTCAEFDIWVWRNGRTKAHRDNMAIYRVMGYKFKERDARKERAKNGLM